MRITVPNFSLKHTLDSGQFFRYRPKGDGYECRERDLAFTVRQKGDYLAFSGTSEEHARQLFGLNQDYEKIIADLKKDKTLLPAINKYHGLRIMQRDLWETIISFQCSIMSNVKKIRLNMNCLATEFGKNNAFPAPGQMNDLERIKKCATGFRAKYILAANELVDEKWLLRLQKMNYEHAREKLMEIPGIAEKVADCICLFSLGHFAAFPVDVWIERIMEKTYFDSKKTKHNDLRAFAQERWGELAGYAQQFLYHHARHNESTQP
ncbi:hypothetical protein C4580_04630 [Candidatus Woesearchaeota archaeon]|nr:MAG: hypothetical protein C4580_04630 [Candidatus Woesearchaeota archaeon]